MFIVYNSKNEVELIATRKEDVRSYVDSEIEKFRVEEVTNEAINDKILKECTGS